MTPELRDAGHLGGLFTLLHHGRSPIATARQRWLAPSWTARVGTTWAATMSRVVLVESDALVRSGLIRLLEDAGHDVGVAAASVDKLPRRAAFDLMILDLAAPGPDAADTVASVSQPVLVLAEELTDVELIDVLGAGAKGLMLKSTVVGLLVDAVQSIVGGGVFIDPHLMNRLVSLMMRSQRGSGPHGLTTQERRVLALLPDGLTNREIAEQLGVSVETVKTHLRNAMRKLGAYDRIDAALIVSDKGVDAL
ncbi:MAG TPA: response regulator transcription factor [Nitriliruptorales bacterium]